MGLPSSKGLRECIKSVQKHYKWGSPKLYFMRFFSIFKNIIFGWMMYFLDLGTDLQFSADMLSNAKRNFTNELNHCKNNIEPMVDSVVLYCKEDFSSRSCYNSVKSLGRTGKGCFETEQRFDEVVSFSHQVLTFSHQVLKKNKSRFCTNFGNIFAPNLSRFHTKVFAIFVTF